MAGAAGRARQWIEQRVEGSGKPVRFLYALVRRYLDDRVGERGALLAYYFLFSLLPFVIFLTSVIGMTEFELGWLFEGEGLIPAEVVGILESYIGYIRGTASPALAWTGLVLTLWFFARATRSLQNALDVAMRVANRRPFIKRTAISFAITLGLLASIPLGLAFAFTGQTVLAVVTQYLPRLDRLLDWVGTLRGIVLAGYSFVLIMAIYMYGSSLRLKARQALPGGLFVLTVWMAASTAFSYYVSNMARYSILYGSLGAVVVLLIWLYITGTVIVLGGEVNAILYDTRVNGG